MPSVLRERRSCPDLNSNNPFAKPVTDSGRSFRSVRYFWGLLAQIRTGKHPAAVVELAKMSGTAFDGMLVRLLLRELKSERMPSSTGT